MNREFEHFIITRFNIAVKYNGTGKKYVKSIDPRTDIGYLKERMRLFEAYTFPSLKAQTNQKFYWIVLFSDLTPEVIKSRIRDLKKQFSNFQPYYLSDEESYDFNNYLSGIMKRYSAENYLTTRIDNDDALSKHYVERLQKYCHGNICNNMMISFPNGLQYTEKKKYVCKQYAVDNHFISLFSENKDRIDSVISFPHNDIPDNINKVCVYSEKQPMWLEVIHQSNFSNITIFHIFNSVKSRRTYEGFDICLDLSSASIIRGVIASIWNTIPFCFRTVHNIGIKGFLSAMKGMVTR